MHLNCRENVSITNTTIGYIKQNTADEKGKELLRLRN